MSSRGQGEGHENGGGGGGERKRESFSLSLSFSFYRLLPHPKDSTLTKSFKSKYLPKATPPKTIIL